MTELPFLPLSTADLSTDCGHLSDAEFGLYMRLLLLMWRTPGGDVPDSDEWLARKMKRPPDFIASTLRPIIGEFCTSQGGRIFQKRLRREFDRARKITRARSLAGKARKLNERRGSK